MGEQGHAEKNSDHEQQTQNPDGKSHLSLFRVRGPAECEDQRRRPCEFLRKFPRSGSLAFQGLVADPCAGTGTHASGQLGAVG